MGFLGPADLLLGERRGEDVAPVSSLRYLINEETLEYDVSDTYLNDYYVKSLLSFEVFATGDFLSKELYLASECTKNDFIENMDNMRFLFRGVALSYLVQDLRYLNHESLKFDKKSYCDLDPKELFKTCKPKTKSMREFLKNSQDLMSLQNQMIIPASHNYKQAKNDFLKSYHSETKSDLTRRLKASCEGLKCTIVTEQDLESLMKRMCIQDKKMVEKICSEEDAHYGYNSSPIALFDLQKNAYVTSVRNLPACLRRYTSYFKKKELGAKALNPIFLAHQFLGAKEFPMHKALELKYFENKGLKSVLSFDEPAKDIKVANEPPKKVPLIEVKKEIPKIAEKKVEKVSIAKAKSEKKKAPEKNYSYFFQSCSDLKNLNLESLKLDMNRFKYDWVFSLEQIEKLNTNLKDYMTSRVLKLLRDQEDLGTNDGPLPLKFLKFLIDENNHESLYNVINVLGDSFYVVSEFDGEEHKVIQKIRILNDESSNNEWQIILLKDAI